ncbi:hypothetical protein [Paenibacillus faecalis]|nr:hypothetical protein [Paenibacillus faecalis]
MKKKVKVLLLTAALLVTVVNVGTIASFADSVQPDKFTAFGHGWGGL